MIDLAPIGIGTYNRINHLKKTISALQNNTLAKQSELYIFSDAPQAGDEKSISNLRNYLHTVGGFKKVYIVERETNGRVANNRGGMKQLLDKYGKVIFLEDDIVTAPGFLEFMNNGLNFYKNDDKILSITGYCPPIKIPNNYNYDFFTLKRFSGWGAGFWADKFDPFGIDIDKTNSTNFFKNKKAIKSFKNNGEDMYSLLQKEIEGKIDALDVKLMYYQFMQNKYTIYPTKSLVQNIGHDGSGLHCVKSNKFDVKLWTKVNFNFSKNITPNKNIIKANFKFRKLTLKDKITELTKFLRIYSFLKMFIK